MSASTLPETASEMEYDAAGELSFKYDKPRPTEQEDKLTRYFDGDGREAKRDAQRCRFVGGEGPEDPCSWGATETIYYIRSTVLGGDVLTEATSAGTAWKRYVYAGGVKIAELSYRLEWNGNAWATKYDAAQFYHNDAAEVSQRVTRNYPETLLGSSSLDPDYIDPRQAEFDSAGGNVGTVSNYTPQPAPPTDPNYPIEDESPLYINGQRITAEIDGVAISWQMIAHLLEHGAAGVDFQRSNPWLLGMLGIYHNHVESPSQPDTPDNPNTPEDDTVIHAGSVADWYEVRSSGWLPQQRKLTKRDVKLLADDIELIIASNPNCLSFIQGILNIAESEGNPIVSKNPIDVLWAVFLRGSIEYVPVPVNEMPSGYSYGSIAGKARIADAITMPPQQQFVGWPGTIYTPSMINDFARYQQLKAASTALNEWMHQSGAFGYDDMRMALATAKYLKIQPPNYGNTRADIRRWSNWWHPKLHNHCSPSIAFDVERGTKK